MVKKIVLVLAFIATVISGGASIEKHNVNIVTPSFDKILVSASVRLLINQADTFSVRLTGGDEDIYDVIDYRVVDGTLVITTKDDECLKMNDVALRITTKGDKYPEIKTGRNFFVIKNEIKKVEGR